MDWFDGFNSKRGLKALNFINGVGFSDEYEDEKKDVNKVSDGVTADDGDAVVYDDSGEYYEDSHEEDLGFQFL